MIFDEFAQNDTYDFDYSKSICRRAKWSIWLQSAFHSANFEYNIIKIREKKFPTFYNIGRFRPPWLDHAPRGQYFLTKIWEVVLGTKRHKMINLELNISNVHAFWPTLMLGNLVSKVAPTENRPTV